MTPARFAEIQRSRQPAFDRAIRGVVRPGSFRDIDGDVAVAYLKKCREAVVTLVLPELACFSSARWLWILRRVPQWLFQEQTDLVPGGSYPLRVAEVLTGWGGAAASSPSHTGPSYPFDRRVAEEVLSLFAAVKFLGRIEWRIRSAARGVPMAFALESDIPDDVRTASDVAAVRHYFERLNRSGERFLKGSGSVFGRSVLNPSQPNSVLTLFLCDPYQRHDEWVDSHGKVTRETISARFSPRCIALDGLASYLEGGETGHLGWPTTDLADILILLRVAAAFFDSSRPFSRSALFTGYGSFEASYFLEELEREIAPAWAHVSHLCGAGAEMPTAVALAERLASVRPSLSPLRLGPVVRRDGDLLLLDLVAATSQLDTLATIPPDNGAASNRRARHFEDTVQAALDASSWAPEPALRRFVRRTLRLQGAALTDIDALGQQGAELLIVSVKSRIFSEGFASGDYSAVRNAASLVHAAAEAANELATALSRFPRGDNYDFSLFTRVTVVVCVPYPIYVPLGIATREVLPGLTAVCSFSELQDFLHPVTPLRSGGTAAPRGGRP